ncbi:MAG: hypothetical protein JWO31_3981 [Phycisphaerales bacterium]|nr:hypothetical protein [Phycisphaerales bacterium]
MLGILSDTHGRADAMGEGMRLLRAAGATAFAHCGDVGSTAVLDHLAGESAAFVFGNNDWDGAELRAYARVIGVRCLDAFGTIELDDRRIAVTHGDDDRLVARVLSEQLHDYLLVGHSHVPAERRVGRTRVINPGALYRARVKTVALLDLASDTLQWLELAPN